MKSKIWSYIYKLTSALLITCILGVTILQPVYAATHPQPSYTSPRDYYVSNLLTVSNTLELDRKEDNLGFPHPESRPGSARMANSLYAEPNAWLTSLGLYDNATPWLLNPLEVYERSASGERVFYGEEQPNLPSLGEIVNDVLGHYSKSQAQNFVYLPVVLRVSSSAELPVVGNKAIFDQLVPNMSMLSSDLDFTSNQVSQVQSVIDDERAAIATLDAEAAVIINDESLSLEEKRAAIIAMDYNGRLRAILQGSQTQLEDDLGDETYTTLVDWLNTEWDLLVAQRRAVRSTLDTGMQLFATDDTTETCKIFDVYATRSTYTDYSADLPDKYVKFANRGWEYSHGYTDTTVYSVTVKYGGEIASNVVVTDIVWNHNDNYWNTVTDTVHPRRMFTDLPHGMPEAEAAYFDGYNGGMNEFGQLVTNPAGMNVSHQVADKLGMGGSAWVQVTFPWGCTPTEMDTESRLEQSWGVNNWSQHVAQLVNPVTGNYSTWYRDLHIPAPGLPVDFVRYYNSQDGVDGIFGRGWSSQFDMRVYPQSDGSYKVRYEDGRRGFFRPNGQGGFEGAYGVFDAFALEGSGFVLTTTEEIVYHFDSGGRLQTIGDLIGNQITLDYTGGNPTKIIDSVGREINLTFDGNGHVTHIEDPAGRVVTYTYGAMTRNVAVLGMKSAAARRPSAMTSSAALQSVTNPGGGTTSYGYDPNTQALAQATDPDGINFVQNMYDAQGRVRAQRNAEGKTGEFEYDVENLRATFTDNLGNKTIYIFDKKFRTIQEIDALGNSVYYKYDDNDNMIEKTDARGHTWKYAYDSRGNMIRREDPLDKYSTYKADVTTWEYNDRNQPTKMVNALGEVTQYEYDEDGNLIKVIEPNGATTTSTFNDKGQMVRMMDAEGRLTLFEYDERGNRNKIVDANGGVTLIVYDDAGRVLSRTDPEGNTVRYEYDGNGNVTKIIDAMGRETRREYNGNNLLTKQIDRRGAVYEFKYDDNLNQIEIKDPLGNVVKYEYDAMYNRTKMIDALGNETTYEYDALYRIVKMTAPLGNITRYEYDENGNMTKAIDAMGGITRFVYDALNRRKFVYDALNHQTEFCYDRLDRVTRIFDPRRAETQFTYDEVGNLIKILDPLGEATKFGYDLVHNRVSLTDPNGHLTRISYDNLNRQIVQTDPLGNTFQTGYDKVGNTTVITDANGNVSTFTYNANYWLTQSTDALGNSVGLEYDKEGNRIQSTDQKGNTTSTVYNLRGQPVEIVDALDYVTQVEYDANGNQIAVTDAKGNVTRYEYDARNRVIKEIDPLTNVTTYRYDGLDRLLEIVDANGNNTTYTYDAISQLIETTDANGESYQYAYDAVGNNTVITDSNGVATQFAYNFLNQIVKEVNPVDKTWEYHYDPAGNMVMKVDGKWQAIRYEYDAANRLIRTRYPDGKSVAYKYDANGNQIEMTDLNGTFTEMYDALNRRTSAIDYAGREIRYTYDDASNLSTMVYPDGKEVDYTYTARHEMEKMTDPAGLVTQYTYDPVGLLTEQVRPNNTRTTFDYDAANRLESLNNMGPSDTVIAKFDFTFDKIGNRTSVTELRAGATAVTYEYGYDDTYQLVSVHSDNGEALTYEYDPVGNRTKLQGTPEPTPTVDVTEPMTVTYEYDDLNSMLRAGEANFSYDDNGNRIQTVKPLSETEYAALDITGTLVSDYIFDVENRMVEARQTISYAAQMGTMMIYTQSLVMEADYSYDGMGRRIAKLVQRYTLDGFTTEVLLREYVYDGLDVVAEYEYPNGALDPDVTYYYYANAAKVSMEKMPAGEQSQKYWYTYDALGSTTALLDESGIAAAEYHHDEYGRLIVGDSTLNRYLYTGQEYDEETGFIHFFARYYDSETGVWLTQDLQRGTMMASASWHRYMYVLNNPINMIDPLGYWPKWADKAANWVGEKASDAVDWVDENVVEPVAETVKDAGEWVDANIVQPVVDTVTEKAEWVNENVIQPVKDKAEKVVNYVNENYVQPAVEKVNEKIESTREALTKAADWIQEHKMAVAASVGFVAGLAAGFIAAGVFCAATAGIGCAIMVGAGAGLVAGGLFAGGTQMFANVFDSSSTTGLWDNVGMAMGVGAFTGAIGGGIGGALSYILPGGAGSNTNPVQGGRGFDSFNQFKSEFGPAGKDQAWHHIVEQNPSNVEKFGPRNIHNTKNLVRLPHGKGTIHSKISGYYSSKQPFTGGQTVRNWISKKSFAEQYKFGVNVIKQFGYTGPLP
jgi:RHS repeat-associated protein